MKYKDLPERWKKKVESYLKSRGIEGRTTLNATDFFSEQVCKIKFEDGSSAEFFYPILIEAADLNEVGVFTEHCGYHIFSMNGTYINLQSSL
ncbi:MAG: hypothetical protein AAF696_09855 [Bacteroidota bacterium]